MSLYFEQIRQLVALQGIDDAIIEVEAELKTAPELLEVLTRDFEAAEAQQVKNADKMAILREQESRSNAEIEDDNARLKKSKSKLSQVSNSREYQAMAREMDSMENVLKSREEDRNTIREEIKSHTAVMEEADARYERLQNEIAECRASLDSRMEAAQKRLDDLKAERARMGDIVPAPVMDRYEFIRRRLSHPVIVPVTDGICDGCHIAIPPQTYIELQGAHNILNCPNCQRLIYWSERFSLDKDSDD